MSNQTNVPPWMANRTTADSDTDPLQEARSWARHGYEIGQRSCTWSDHGVAPEWLTGWHSFETPSSAADETCDETTSAAPMPAEDGNVSERPNAGRETPPEELRLRAAYYNQGYEDGSSVTRLPAERRAASWWEAAKRQCRFKRHSDWLVSQWKTAAGEQYARADAAEAKLAEISDWAEAKEASTREWDKNHNTECECEVAQTTYEVLAELRKIVNPEAGQ